MKHTLVYTLFSLFLTIVIGCKTTHLNAHSPSDEIGANPQLCQQVFKSAEKTALERYTYENERLVRTDRLNAEGESIFTETTEWSGDRIALKRRKNAQKTIFEIRYHYENGLLKRREIDDTNEKGELTPDGKMDREETYFYTPSNKENDEPRLTKISIKRENMPIILVNVEYSDSGLERQRTSRSNDKILEINRSFYTDSRKTKSVVELQDATLLEYQYTYDAGGSLIETTRSASNSNATQRWSRKYNCSGEK